MQTQEPNQSVTTNETEKLSVKNVCCGIYGLRNKANGKWYVGQSTDIHRRWRLAYKNMGCIKQRKIYNALRKYGYDSFDKVVLEECENNQETLNVRETHWVMFHDSINRGYNLRLPDTKKHSPETIEKIRKTNTGKKHSEETKKKMSDWQKGKRLSDAHKHMLSLSMRGKKRASLSPSHKTKMSESVRLSWIKRRLQKVETTPSTV